MHERSYQIPHDGPRLDGWRQWLNANGVNTSQVVKGSFVTVDSDDGTFEVTEFILDDARARIVHTPQCGCAGGIHLAKHAVTYDLLVPVGQWAQA